MTRRHAPASNLHDGVLMRPNQVLERNRRFYRRQLGDGILFRASLPSSGSPWDDEDWGERECLCLTDMEGIIERIRQALRASQEVEDDSIPVGYPTVHFGESVYSAILGGEIKFVGNRLHTCSGAQPLLHDWSDLEKLRLDAENPWALVFLDSLRRAVQLACGDFLIVPFITIDALNLAVELRGTTQAYLDLHESPQELRRLMAFGVELNVWFYQLQQEVIRDYNLAALGDPLALALTLPTLSIDAYDICHESAYRDFGLEFHQALIKRLEGGHMHTHGTGLFRLLPYVVKLRGLTSLQLGGDLYSGETIPMLEHLPELRRLTADIPLFVSLTQEEFELGLRERILPGGASYSVLCPDVATANDLAAQAREYRPEGRV